jgi:hypothetical protein
VDTHLTNIFKKLGVSSRVLLVRHLDGAGGGTAAAAAAAPADGSEHHAEAVGEPARQPRVRRQ